MLIWGGMAFRLWAILTLGRYFRTTVFLQGDHKLIANGPYRFIRHPAYTGSIITITGIGLFMNNWISVLGAFAISLVGYVRRIYVEEDALHSAFGPQYEELRSKTWAVFPLVW